VASIGNIIRTKALSPTIIYYLPLKTIDYVFEVIIKQKNIVLLKMPQVQQQLKQRIFMRRVTLRALNLACLRLGRNKVTYYR
jgi:hypothetical protein